jgi:hypothetical protein
MRQLGLLLATHKSAIITLHFIPRPLKMQAKSAPEAPAGAAAGHE